MIAEIPILRILAFLVFSSSSIFIYLSDFQYLNDKIDKLLDRFKYRLQRADFEIPRGFLARIFIGVVTFHIFIGYLYGFVISLTLMFSTFVSLIIILHLRIKQKDQTLNQIDDEICFSLSRSLRAGRTLEASVFEISKQFAGSDLLEPLSELIEKGIPFTSALKFVLDNETKTRDSKSALFVSAIYIAHSMGGNSARIFEKIGDYYSNIYELRKDCTASLSQVKLSTLIISLLPIAMLAMSVLFNAGTVSFLITNPLGLICLIVGSIFQLSGIYWMKHQIKVGVSQWIS